MANKRREHSGRKYGQLLMLNYLRAHPRGRGAIWGALCDCGKSTEVVASDAASGRVRTCGNCRGSLGIRGSEGVTTVGLDRGFRRAFRRVLREWNSLPNSGEFPTRDWTSRCGMPCGLCRAESPRNYPVPLPMPRSVEELYGTIQLIPVCSECDAMTRGKRKRILDWLRRILNRFDPG